MTVQLGKADLDGTPCATDFELIAESIPHIVWMAAPDGSTEYLNRRGTEYTGLPREASYGWNWLSLIHPDDARGAAAAWEYAVGTETPYNLDSRIRRADGEFRWHSCRGQAVRGRDGQLVKWIGTATDVDEQQRLAEGLCRSQREAAETLTLLETLQSTAPVGFLFVDRDFRYVRVNDKAAAINGLPAAEHLGRRVAEVVPTLWPAIEPVYRRVLDRAEAVVNLEMTGETAAEPGRVHHWLVSYYPVRVDREIIGIGVVIVDITRRKEAEQAHRDLTRAAVAAIAATVEARDPYTAGHQRRVANISVAIANELCVDPEAVEGIELAATIHDIGKVGIPSEILTRPARLNHAELELVQGHSQAGADILSGIKFPWPVREMVAQHHERFDGSGYPDGLRGDEITLGARIIAVADVVEAMASHRPYRPALGIEAALKEIESGRDRLFDPDVVDACLRLFREGRLDLDLESAIAQ